MDIMTALATASQAIKLTRELRGIDKAIDAAEYKLKIADLTSVLSDIKLALTEARDELASKDSEITRLKKQFARASETVEISGFLFDKKEDGTPSGHAYCPVCFQKDGFMFHLTGSTKSGQFEDCPNCRASYDIWSYG